MDAKRAKILMIGNKDSGKTTYMASAYGLLKKGLYGFHIQGDSENDEWFSKIYRGIKVGAYPVPTDKRGRYDFELCFNDQPLLTFEWLDYFGGVISESRSEELQEDIDHADGIMLFLEADALLHDDRKKTQFRRILSLISEKLVAQERSFNVIIVLTKYDVVGNTVRFDEVCKPLENFKQAVSGNKNIRFRIVPVSCTKSGFSNVELPLLDILHSCLGIKVLSIRVQVLSDLDEYAGLSARSGFFDWLSSRLVGTPTNEELAEIYYARAKKEAQRLEDLAEPYRQLSKLIESYQLVIPGPVIASHNATGKTARNRFNL